jgi:hypothetical protein
MSTPDVGDYAVLIVLLFAAALFCYYFFPRIFHTDSSRHAILGALAEVAPYLFVAVVGGVAWWLWAT